MPDLRRDSKDLQAMGTSLQKTRRKSLCSLLLQMRTPSKLVRIMEMRLRYTGAKARRGTQAHPRQRTCRDRKSNRGLQKTKTRAGPAARYQSCKSQKETIKQRPQAGKSVEYPIIPLHINFPPASSIWRIVQRQHRSLAPRSAPGSTPGCASTGWRTTT